MYKKGIDGFPYYLGVNSLADVATRADRVCVLNILGGESRQVTPVKPRLLEPQCGVRDVTGAPRSGALDRSRRYSGLQQRA
jgi:hypothetical protein